MDKQASADLMASVRLAIAAATQCAAAADEAGRACFDVRDERVDRSAGKTRMLSLWLADAFAAHLPFGNNQLTRP